MYRLARSVLQGCDGLYNRLGRYLLATLGFMAFLSVGVHVGLAFAAELPPDGGDAQPMIDRWDEMIWEVAGGDATRFTQIKAVMWVESAGRQFAVSRTGDGFGAAPAQEVAAREAAEDAAPGQGGQVRAGAREVCRTQEIGHLEVPDPVELECRRPGLRRPRAPVQV